MDNKNREVNVLFNWRGVLCCMVSQIGIYRFVTSGQKHSFFNCEYRANKSGFSCLS